MAYGFGNPNKGAQKQTGNQYMEIYIEFFKDAAYEEPFFISGRKFVYCWGKRADGRIDNAVYSFAGDVTFSYEYFQSLLGK